ncbi:MAG: hypothetical protein ACKO1I_18100, partial [Microcystis aeruginosa]
YFMLIERVREWGSGEVGCGEVGKWGSGEVGKWGVTPPTPPTSGGKWGSGEVANLAEISPSPYFPKSLFP